MAGSEFIGILVKQTAIEWAKKTGAYPYYNPYIVRG